MNDFTKTSAISKALQVNDEIINLLVVLQNSNNTADHANQWLCIIDTAINGLICSAGVDTQRQISRWVNLLDIQDLDDSLSVRIINNLLKNAFAAITDDVVADIRDNAIFEYNKYERK